MQWKLTSLYFFQNKDYQAPEGTYPPLLVKVHGGPTSACSPILNLSRQFFTSRGFALLDVNYRGSTGYGRKYRNMLKPKWVVKNVRQQYYWFYEAVILSCSFRYRRISKSSYNLCKIYQLAHLKSSETPKVWSTPVGKSSLCCTMEPPILSGNLSFYLSNKTYKGTMEC